MKLYLCQTGSDAALLREQAEWFLGGLGGAGSLAYAGNILQITLGTDQVPEEDSGLIHGIGGDYKFMVENRMHLHHETFGNQCDLVYLDAEYKHPTKGQIGRASCRERV